MNKKLRKNGLSDTKTAEILLRSAAETCRMVAVEREGRRTEEREYDANVVILFAAATILLERADVLEAISE